MTEINNRIEEVIDIVSEAWNNGVLDYKSRPNEEERRAVLAFIPYKKIKHDVPTLARQIDQLYSQPLDDKELREKALLTDGEIERAVLSLPTYVSGDKSGGRVGTRVYRDSKQERRAVADKATGKALVLLQPKIEEARRRGIREAIDNLKMHHCIVDVEARIKEIENEHSKEG